MNWLIQYRLHRTRQDFGANVFKTHQGKPWKLALIRFWYHPSTEIITLILILLSLVFVFLEFSTEQIASTSWIKSPWAKTFLLQADLAITTFFVLEILCKLMVAPRTVFFLKKNLVDIIAILPLFRVFRLARTARLLRILRIFRTVRVGRILRSDLVKKRTHILFRSETTTMVTYLLLSVIFGTFGIMYFERETNEMFGTVSDGLWWCIVTITTVGYGDKFPITLGGRIIAITIMFVGLSFYALLTGTISTFLIERTQNIGDKQMDLDILDDHIIICGWNDDVLKIVETLMISTDKMVLIIAEHSNVEIQNSRVCFLRATPSNKHALQKGRIERAFSVIILSECIDGRSSQDIDAKSILIALAVNICNPNIHITLELQDQENSEHARNAGVNDFITSTAFQGSLLAQSASSPGVAELFSQIFINPQTFIQRIPVEEIFVGNSYLSLVQHFTEKGDVAVLGLARDEQILLSPNADYCIQSSDELLLLISRSAS